MASVALTGASGFVGRHVAPRLVSQGYEVRGLARLASRIPAQLNRIELVPGDITELKAVESLVTGCDAVVHIGPGEAVTPEGREVHEAGTRTVVAAAQGAGVGRLVYLSCLGAEAAGPASLQAKWKAERLIQASGVPFVILRSSLILGRDDGFVRPLASLIRASPIVPVPGDGQQRQQPIDVDDLAACLVAAVGSDSVAGEVVAVGGPSFLTFRELIDLISGQLGVMRRKLLVPYRLLPAVARALPPGLRPVYSDARMAQFRQGVVTSPGIVQRTFGLEPRSIPSQLAAYLA